MDDEPKPIQPSRSGGAGRDKEERKRPGRRSPSRAARQARTLALGAILGLAEDAFVRDVAAGQITREQAEVCRTTLASVLDCLPMHALTRLHRNLTGFCWHASTTLIDRVYRERYRDPGEAIVQAFYDPTERMIHLTVENSPNDYAHEIAHAVDGPEFELTKSPRWKEAYNTERGRLSSDAYSTSNPQEWWATLSAFLLLEPDAWSTLRKRIPRSARILEGVYRG